MRLIRRHGEHQRIHRDASWWASVSVGILLLVVVALAHTWQSFDMHLGLSLLGEPLKTKPDARRLGDSAYPHDLIITHDPYEDAPPGQKVAIIIHIILIGYMLLGLNTVCDVYFCGALDMMVDKWEIEPDVAGATFMAAGGSAPELFTSLIGATITVNDVGFGTIVGSAVFNVLAVIGACGIAAESPIKLTWWPLFRDCCFYIFALSLLAIFAYGETVTLEDGRKVGGGAIQLWEAILLFATYIGYCTIMYCNQNIEAYVKDFIAKYIKKHKDLPKVTPVEDENELRDCAEGDAPPGPPEHHIGRTQAAEDPSSLQNLEEGDTSAQLQNLHHNYHIQHHIRVLHHNVQSSPRQSQSARPSCNWGETSSQKSKPSVEPELKKCGSFRVNGWRVPVSSESVEEEQPADEVSEATDAAVDIEALMIKPADTRGQIQWYLSLPIYVPLYYGIPKPTERWFLATFGISLMWIGGFSFLLVYCVEVFGAVVFGGGNAVTIVMSLTLLAMGTSIPDLVSSMAVARAGEGDMAVSSSIGSNIFDILVGLPIPWIIKILFVETVGKHNPGAEVSITSPYIPIYVFLLLVMVFSVIVSIHYLGWVLNRKLGLCMALLYIVFLSIVLPIELVDGGPYL